MAIMLRDGDSVVTDSGIYLLNCKGVIYFWANTGTDNPPIGKKMAGFLFSDPETKEISFDTIDVVSD